MIRSKCLAVLLPILLTAGCGERTADMAATRSPATPAASVEQFLETYVEAVSTLDTAALRGMYAGPERFAWIEEGAVRYRSADEVLESLAAFTSGATIETELGDVDVVRLSGGGAHAWASFTTTVGGEGGGYSFGGLMSFVLEPSDTDAGWRIVGGHVSTPRERG